MYKMNTLTGKIINISNTELKKVFKKSPIKSVRHPATRVFRSVLYGSDRESVFLADMYVTIPFVLIASIDAIAAPIIPHIPINTILRKILSKAVVKLMEKTSRVFLCRIRNDSLIENIL